MNGDNRTVWRLQSVLETDPMEDFNMWHYTSDEVQKE